MNRHKFYMSDTVCNICAHITQVENGAFVMETLVPNEMKISNQQLHLNQFFRMHSNKIALTDGFLLDST